MNRKQRATDSSPDRNLQFDYIADLRDRFRRRHMPIISVDTKKRELVGNFRNPGATWLVSPRQVNDHDFRSDSIGVAIPFGVYDLSRNRGSVVVGTSHDTPAFAAHAIAHWWQHEGLLDYAGSRQLLIPADTGGSNGYRCRTWKTELQSQVADDLGLAVTVAHYPTGTSKWNPIEHRLFSEISKNWAGEPLDSYRKILNFIRTTPPRPVSAVSASLPISIAAAIRQAPNPLRKLQPIFGSTLTKSFLAGITPFTRICDVISASALSPFATQVRVVAVHEPVGRHT